MEKIIKIFKMQFPNAQLQDPHIVTLLTKITDIVHENKWNIGKIIFKDIKKDKAMVDYDGVIHEISLSFKIN